MNVGLLAGFVRDLILLLPDARPPSAPLCFTWERGTEALACEEDFPVRDFPNLWPDIIHFDLVDGRGDSPGGRAPRGDGEGPEASLPFTLLFNSQELALLRPRS